MPDVIFNPDQNNDFGFRGERGGSASSGFITKVAMKLTGIQDEQKINQALVAVTVICFAISGYVLWSTFF
jgi:hypothetical protein